jgi:2-polyprenyl-3-methyl-5-hydroxy-6-metoxy-1,4-benzoquinol methylase
LTDQDKAKSYFDRLAPEYDRAFDQAGRNPVNAVVNRFFRGPTFARRMRLLEGLFAELGLAGRRVLDLGCGSGQVSLLAASMGAQVHAIDIAPRMIEIARESARRAGLAERLTFVEGDVSTAPLPPADVVLLVGVLEYYADYAALLRRAAAAAGGTLIVAHTTRVPHRMALRRLLFLWKGAALYFHRMPDVIAAGALAGLRLAREVRDPAFSILVFVRGGGEEAGPPR